jgi:hypothetical protein
LKAPPEREGGPRPGAALDTTTDTTTVAGILRPSSDAYLFDTPDGPFLITTNGWRPATAEGVARLAAIASRSYPRPGRPVAIPGTPEPCVVCGRDAEPSAVGTPTCSMECVGCLADQVLPLIADQLQERGSPQATPPPKPRPPRPALREGVASVERALERIGDCRRVFERHRVHVRGRMALCPFHDERTPSLSIFTTRTGRSRVHCHGCGWSGDAIDLEAALGGEDLVTTIRRWGR